MLLASLSDSQGVGTIALVAAVDGAVRSLRRLSGWINESPEHMSLSPDGRYVAYDYPEGPAAIDRAIFILDTHTGDQWPLAVAPGHDTSPVWTADGRAMVFFSDRNRTFSAWAVAMANGRPQGAPQLVKDDVGRVLARGFTRDGALHVDVVTGFGELYLSSLERGASGLQLLSPRQSLSNLYPRWSPDGRWLAYLSEQRHRLSTGALDLRRRVTDRIARAGDGEDRYRSGVVARLDRAPGARGEQRPSNPVRSVFPMAIDGRSALAAFASGRVTLRDLRTGATREWLDSGVTFMGRHVMAPHTAAVAYLADRKDLMGQARTLMVWGGAGDPRELLRVREPEQIVLHDWTADGLSLLVTDGPPDPMRRRTARRSGRCGASRFPVERPCPRDWHGSAARYLDPPGRPPDRLQRPLPALGVLGDGKPDP
jgi:hypothetical protein